MREFSLVELSIVLVILGLLTGGIPTGQTLIKANAALWLNRLTGLLFGQNGNNIWLGHEKEALPTSLVLTAEEAWNIDTKLDDGEPDSAESFLLKVRQPVMTTTATRSTFNPLVVQ